MDISKLSEGDKLLNVLIQTKPSLSKIETTIEAFEVVRVFLKEETVQMVKGDFIHNKKLSELNYLTQFYFGLNIGLSKYCLPHEKEKTIKELKSLIPHLLAQEKEKIEAEYSSKITNLEALIKVVNK